VWAPIANDDRLTTAILLDRVDVRRLVLAGRRRSRDAHRRAVLGAGEPTAADGLPAALPAAHAQVFARVPKLALDLAVEHPRLPAILLSTDGQTPGE
jgi:hypothetical protein